METAEGPDKFNFKSLLTILICLILTVFVSGVQHLTGPELALTLFYLFPIILATWKAGIWAGIFISFAGSAFWFIADSIVIEKFSSKIIPYFNVTFRLIGFLVITYIVSELKGALAKHKELADTDPLTSLFNRRAFCELSAFELHKARRFNYSLSIICFDVDNFKTVNDSLGHDAGDRLLIAVSKVIKSNVRKIDLAGRLGGDEFAIILIGSAADQAYLVADKLKHILLDAMKTAGWPVTFSIGLVTFQKPPESVDEMIRKGDILMYTAKRNGKNMIRHLIIN